jgi:hypothetical protein
VKSRIILLSKATKFNSELEEKNKTAGCLLGFQLFLIGFTCLSVFAVVGI